MPSMTLAELASALGAEVRGNGELVIEAVATLDNATSAHIAFLANSKYRNRLAESQAGAVILSAQEAEKYSGNALVMANPYLGYAKVAQLLDTTPVCAEAIHVKCGMDSARLGHNVSEARMW